MSIIIDEEFKNLIPPLSPDEFAQLEENCTKEGIRDDLIVWETPNGTKVLIDGHNRFQIAARHGLHWNERVMLFKSRDEAREWIIRNQFGRRNLSAYDRSILALKLKPIIAEKAKERMVNAPQKKAEQEKEIKKIWEEHDFDTARDLVAIKKQEFARKTRAEIMANGKYVYYARFSDNKLKIGSSICPEERIKQLSVSCPDIKLIETIFYGAGAEKHENAIKKKYGQYQIGNECYQCSDEIMYQMISFTKKEADRKNNTNYQLAQIAGVSPDTIHKVEAIEKSNDTKLKEQIRSGDVSINQGYRIVKGIEDKHPAKAMQEFVEKKKEEHKEFKGKKTVSLDEIKADKETKHFLAMDAYTKLMRMGKQITDISLAVADGDINLEEVAKELTEEEQVTLITTIAKWIVQLTTIQEVISA